MEDLEILFVDDEVEILNMVGEYLSREGYKTTLSDNGLHALGLVKERPFDVVFTDFKMPGFDGLELMAAIKAHRSETEVIMVTGFGTIESAITAMKFGGYDYIQKPIKLAQLKILCEKISAEKKLKDSNLFLKKNLKQRTGYRGLIGISPQMQKNYEIMERIGWSSPSILIQGEKGTGKELVARIIHKTSDRAHKPFVHVNCSAIVEGAPESGLFDHVTELFDAARAGTIYLDEIEEIPPFLQPRLLHDFHQSDESPKEGKGAPRRDVRIIAATEKDAGQLVRRETLREDFVQRQKFFFINLPPLRERREDICLLVNYFLSIYRNGACEKALTLSPEVMDIFLAYHWPGNVMQLENVVKKAIGAGAEKAIDVVHLPRQMRELAMKNVGDL